MQKVITVRSSQKWLDNELKPYTLKGWKVVSISKGSGWTRVFDTYKWTVVLEKEEPKQNQQASPASELDKAYALYKKGAISLEEYNKLKQKILNK